MRAIAWIGVYVLGLVAVVAGAVGVARGADTCTGTVFTFANGGGGILCSRDFDTPPCEIHFVQVEPESVHKWCSCANVEVPVCCHVVWFQVFGSAPDSAYPEGECSPPNAACPPGTCTMTTVPGVEGDKHTAACE